MLATALFRTLVFLRTLALPAALLCSCPPSWAASSPAFEHVNRLPTYCRDLADSAVMAERRTHWEAYFGSTLQELSDVCLAYDYEVRAREAANDSARDQHLNSALSHLNSALATVDTSTYQKLHLLYLKRGQLHLALGNAQGVADVQQAIQLDNNWQRPYLVLFHHYHGNGRHNDAQAVLNSGLQQFPGSTRLLNAQQQLNNAQ